MKRITAYIFGQIILAALFVLATLTLAIWLTQSLRVIELIVNRGLTMGAFANLTLLLLPLAVLLWLTESTEQRAKRLHRNGWSQRRIAEHMRITRYRVRVALA